MHKSIIAAAVWICALSVHNPAVAATNETAKADLNRRKPLQRCDQLAEKAQLECLHKARERVVEARSKREASTHKGATPVERQGARESKSGAAENPGARPDPK